MGGLLLGYTLRLGMHAEQLGDWWGLESKHGHQRQILQHCVCNRAPYRCGAMHVMLQHVGARASCLVYFTCVDHVIAFGTLFQRFLHIC